MGGGGSNAVNRMIQSDVGGVEFFVVNTDSQARSFQKFGGLEILGFGDVSGRYRK